MNKDDQIVKSSSKILEEMARTKGSFFTFRFVDEDMEYEFQRNFIENYSKNALLIYISSIIFFVYRLFFSKMRIEQSFLIVIDLIILILCFFLISCISIFKQNLNLRKKLYILFLNIITFYNIFSTIFSCLKAKDPEKNKEIQSVDIFILINIFNLSLCKEISFGYFISFNLLNSLTMIFLTAYKISSEEPLYKHLILYILTSVIIIKFIREKSRLNRINYYYHSKLKKDNNSFNDLINNSNGLIFRIRKNEIIESNDNFKKFVISDFKQIEKIMNLKGDAEENESKLEAKRDLKNKITTNNKLKNISCRNEINKIHDYQNQNLNKNEFFFSPELNMDKNFRNKTQNLSQDKMFLVNKAQENSTFLNFNNSLLNLKIDNNKTIMTIDNNLKKSFSKNINGRNFLLNLETFNFSINFEKLKFSKLLEPYLKFSWTTLQQAILDIQDIEEFNHEKFESLGEIYSEITNDYFEVFYKIQENRTIIDLYLNPISDSNYIEKKIENENETNYFAKMAHEFKTPLNSIIGLIKNLQTTYSKFININFDNLKTSFSQIENLSKYVIFLINDVIDYTKISNAKKLNSSILEEINLKEITDFCSDIIQALLINKGKEDKIKVENIFDIKINNLKIISDDFRLKQVLLNFISNSVKFTKSGFIKINSEIIAEESNFINNKLVNELNNDSKEYNYVKISIIDSGMGITEEELNKLLKFDDYNMLEQGKKYNKEGSGLGLSISNEIIKQLNHEFFVESIQGKGSCFGIKIKAEIIKDPILKSYINISKDNSDISNGENNILKICTLDAKTSYENRNYSEQYDEILAEFKNFKKFVGKDKLTKYLNFKQSSNNFEGKIKYSAIDIHNNISNNIFPISSEHKIFKNKTDSKEETQLQSLNRKFSNKTLNTKKSYDFEDSQMNKDTDIIPDSKINLEISKIPLICKNFTFNTDNKSRKSSSEIHSNNKFYYNVSNDNSTFIKNNNLISFNESSIMIDNSNLKNINFYSRKNFNLDIERLESSKRDKISETLNSFPKMRKNQSRFNFKSPQEMEMLSSIKNKIKRELTDNKNIILVVDDNKIIRKSLKNMINKILDKTNNAGEFKVKEGDEGSFIIRQIIKDQFNQNKIKCVITDENMEFINGSHAVKFLKGLEDKHQIKPVIYASFTNHEDEAIKIQMRKYGINYFIPKLCNEQLLTEFFIKNKIFEN